MKAILFILLSASAALAFTTTHLVVVESAVVYDEAHNYEDDYVVAALPYWTPVEAEPVGSPESARTYCFVKLADGRAGLTEWDYLGRALQAVKDGVLVYAEPGEGAVKARLSKSELVAFVLIDGRTDPDHFGVTTAGGTEGWVRKSDVAALAPSSE